MFLKEKSSYKIFFIFLLFHLLIWTLVPTFSNNNLPLDVIEALAWSSEFELGYSKHPPFSAWFPGFFYLIFKNQDWAYYLLSQLFVVITFFTIFKFSEDFLQNKILSLISVLLLEGIFFYNFTTPEFNVNVCQLPFWALTVYFCWRGIKKNEITSWVLFGMFAAFGFLSKYLFLYLLASLDIFFIYLIFKKKFKFKCLVSIPIFFLILTPHLIWLVQNDYSTVIYALSRTGTNELNYFNHILHPSIFLMKQVGILIPFFIMIYFIISKLKFKFNLKDKKFLFLLTINFVPIILMFLTSAFMGAQIRTMWMTPFYMFYGVLFLYIFQKGIILKKINYFLYVFLFLFLFYPAGYFYVSISQTDKRTDYPGKKIANVVQSKWENNFIGEIGVVGGDEWHAGNLSYHLKSRPKWDNILESKKISPSKNTNDGFVLIANQDILSEVCNGYFFKIENQGVCMIGKKR
jgi:4-amino-4-deoxy-L-arabinose transferase-like glycosyltransferase